MPSAPFVDAGEIFHRVVENHDDLKVNNDQTINIVLVALTDAVEVELWADGLLRRRMRFLRDTEARKFSERIAARLHRRGYAPVLPQ